MTQDALDTLRAQVDDIILARQDPGTGLLPASTAVTVHGDYRHAWVRDNVYSILAVWALALAYRRAGRGAAAAPLEDAVTRLMRGLLAAMLRQAHKVERFKHTQDPLDALHAKYDTAHGEPVVGDADWGHLQIDATAIFVLMLAQMSASGLRLVRTADEQAFVQNLVHYLAQAWRTPDYGIWERGHKRNEGVAERNASSIGMAKAALEAIAGFEPLPGVAPPVQVMAGDIAHARDTLAALLPRESVSKETDAALLSITGYPAFAVDDPELAKRTQATVLAKLQGRYGCKRFLRDGHQTVLEDHARLHYEPGELQQFEHIESEWPLFFTYLLIDAALAGDAEAAAHWRTRLEALMQECDGQRLLPELYVVPAEAVEAERASPHSQAREPNANVPLVWAQSLYLVGVLLHEGLVHPEDLDPLGRRLGDAVRPEVRVQVLLLAEDELVRSRLAVQGLAASTAAELQPLAVIDAAELAQALAGLGRSEALGLTGRPLHPLSSLTTGQLFEHAGGQALCLPPLCQRGGFYLALDNRLLVEQIGSELAYLHRHWRGDGQPLLLLPIGAELLDAPGADALLGFLRELAARGEGPGGGVDLAPPAPQLARAVRCRLPGLRLAATGSASADTGAGTSPDWDEAATRPLSAPRAAAIAAETGADLLWRTFARSRNPYEQAEVLAALARRDDTDREALRRHAEALYARAAQRRRWGLVRRAAGLLRLHDDALEDAVAQLLAAGKRVALGRAYGAGAVVDRPLSRSELVERIERFGGDDPRGRALIEEVVLLLGLLAKADATLFEGTLTLRPWQSVRLLTAWLAREHGVASAEAFEHLLELSPHAVLGRLREVFAREQEMAANVLRMQSLHRVGGGAALVHVQFPPAFDPALPDGPGEGGWAAWRETAGAIGRTPADFHARVWALLQHCGGLVIGDQLDRANRLDSALARADSTPGEHGFALQVDELLQRIAAPEYRQLCIEALLALSDITEANPELRIGEALVLDVLIGIAVRLGWQEGRADADYNEHVSQAWQAFYAAPPHRVANLVMAAVAHLLEPEADTA
ncbi:glycoside hydrolase family 15 protein [Piscinibacter defluvii]|uniref:glycoside hydrolase family 15 protein n=1 Tax=Piscinibacter defluvii TaxID=1796922 RepID=UPI000FDF22A8|nr:glycoside hydrolase family 15 protein [Piscinibacter defluvii]